MEAWHFPNRVKNWDEDSYKDGKYGTIKNYYATIFKDAWNVGKYLNEDLDRLEKHSRDFHNALFNSTLPSYVIDAVSSNITVARSTTCFRLEDGTFLGWEGCFDGGGCCAGSCTHVWNYAQTIAFLFPDLEQSMRKGCFFVPGQREEDLKFLLYTLMKSGRGLNIRLQPI